MAAAQPVVTSGVFDAHVSAHGESLFALANRIFCMSQEFGSTDMLRRAEELRTRVADTFVGGCVGFFAARSHETMSASTFDDHIHASLDYSKTSSEGWKQIVRHFQLTVNFLALHTATPSQLAFHLAQGHRYALVDRFEALMRVCARLILDGDRALLLKHARPLARLEADVRVDPRLRNLSMMLAGKGTLPLSEEERQLAAARGSLEVGAFEDASSTLMANAPRLRHRLEFWGFCSEIAAVSPATTSCSDVLNGSPIGRRLLELESSTGRQRERVLLELRKDAYQRESTLLGMQLGAAIRAESEPLDTHASFVHPSLFACVVDPMIALSISDPRARQDVLLRLDAAYGESVISAYWKKTLQQDAPASDVLGGLRLSLRRETEAQVALFSGSTDEAISAYEALLVNGATSGARATAAAVLVGLYVKAGLHERAVRFIASDYLSAAPQLGTKLVVDIIDRFHRDRPPSALRLIEWPLLHLVAGDDLPRRPDVDFTYLAVDDCLAAHGLEKPSDLYLVKDRFDERSLVTVMRYACTIAHLDSMNAFANSEQVFRERLLILQQLESLFAVSASELESERQDISRRLVVRHLLQAAEQRKVYVDVRGVRRSLPDSLLESIAHYLAMRSTGSDARIIVVRRAETGRAFDFQLSEANYGLVFFRRAFVAVRDRYIASDEFGLDSFLSVQIRHGTLSAHLRKPFEVRHLVGKRAASGAYGRNDIWSSEEPAFSDSGDYSIDSILADLSRSVDETIDMVKQSLVQVRSDEIAADGGLFDYRFSAADVLAVSQLIDASADVDGVLDVIFAALRHRTLENLAHIRAALPTTVGARLREAIDVAVQKVRSCSPMHVDLVRALVQCRTDTEVQISALVKWFALSEDDEFPDFEMGTVVHAVVELIRQTVPSLETTFKPRIVLDDVGRLRGSSFRHLFNVVFGLVDNAVRHGLNVAEECEIRALSRDNRIEIAVSNAISSESAKALGGNFCTELANRAMRPASLNAVRTEGNSGFYKLGKMLRIDLNRTAYSVEIDCDTSRNRFCVLVSMDSGGLDAVLDN